MLIKPFVPSALDVSLRNKVQTVHRDRLTGTEYKNGLQTHTMGIWELFQTNSLS